MVQNAQQQPQQPNSTTPSNNNNVSMRCAIVAATSPVPKPNANAKRQRPARSPMPDTGTLPGARPSLTNNTLRKSGRKNRAKRRSISLESQDGEADLKTMGDDNEVSVDEETVKMNQHTRPPHSWQLVRVEVKRETSAPVVQIYELITINKNMVIDGVTFAGMTCFVFGDQIHEVNDQVVNTRKQFEQALMKLPANGTQFVISVIRPWNVRCATLPLFQQLTTVDEKLTYLVVRVHRFNRSNSGFSLGTVKRKVTITELRPKTKGSISFFIADTILGIIDPDTNLLFEKPSDSRDRDVDFLQEVYWVSMRKLGYVDYFVCRVRDAHTAPNASIHGDVQTLVERRDWGYETPPVVEKKAADIFDPPLESDAVEIALRELYRIKLLTQSLDNGPVVVPMPKKGKSLIKVPSTLQNPRPLQAQQSSSNNSCYEKLSPVIEKSLYEPYANMPKPAKKGGSRWGRKSSPAPPARQCNIRLKETHETSDIMSDIPAEMELKGVDASSGLVGFIFSAFKKKDCTKPAEKK